MKKRSFALLACTALLAVGCASNKGKPQKIGGDVLFLPFSGMKGEPVSTVLTTSDVGVSFTFNPDGTVTIQKDSLTEPYTITTTFDKSGKVMDRKGRFGEVRRYAYTPDGVEIPLYEGEPLKFMSRSGDTLRWSYPGEEGKLIETVFSGLTQTTNFGKGSETNYTRTYDEAGRILTLNEDCAKNTYTYDAAGNLIKEERGSDCVAEKEVRTYNYTAFDENGNWTEREADIVVSVAGTEDRWASAEHKTVETRKINYGK